MLNKHHLNWLTISLLIACLLGCTAANHQRLLRKNVDRYNQQLRWALMEDAQSFVDAEYLENWRTSHLGGQNNLKIVSIEPRLIKVTQTKPPAAFFKTRIVWYLEGNLRVQESLWEQEWKFHKSKWMLMSEKRLDGDSQKWP